MIEHYRAWLLKRPGDRLAMYGLALELKKAGLHEEARVAFEDLLAAHPQSGAGWFQYGRLFEDAGDEAEALAVWTRGLAALQGSDDPEAKRSTAEIRSALAALD